uniref:Ig-like domain-containing protein n=1 Tax=Sinocyclocheilus grahami TaxID=75366 RepID=A0A672NQT6_SINGR
GKFCLQFSLWGLTVIPLHPLNSLTDKRVNLGQNVTLDCQIDVKDIYWVFQKGTDSPVLILRTFSSESTISRLKNQSLKNKYSSLTLSRLFISNVTINELGIYYCVKTGSFLQLSDGIRLDIIDEELEQLYSTNGEEVRRSYSEFSVCLLNIIFLHGH